VKHVHGVNRVDALVNRVHKGVLRSLRNTSTHPNADSSGASCAFDGSPYDEYGMHTFVQSVDANSIDVAVTGLGPVGVEHLARETGARCVFVMDRAILRIPLDQGTLSGSSTCKAERLSRRRDFALAPARTADTGTCARHIPTIFCAGVILAGIVWSLGSISLYGG
jgi:hypothetical protein